MKVFAGFLFLSVLHGQSYVLPIQGGTGNGSGGGGGGGATAFNALTTCQVVRTSGTVLTIVASGSDPCQINKGGIVTTYSSNSTFTLTGAASGTPRIPI